jgi:hypothetical protein
LGLDGVIAGVERIVELWWSPSISVSLGRHDVVLLKIDEQSVSSGVVAVKGMHEKRTLLINPLDFAFSNSIMPAHG